MLDALMMSLWMGFLAAAVTAVGVYLFRKAVLGDLTFQEAAGAWLPLACCFLVMYATRHSAISWIFGMAGVGWLAWVALRRRREEKEIEEALIAQEIEKWSAAIAADDRNAGAHLFLGHALVQRGDFDTAAWHYQRALQLYPENVRDLLAFLGQRTEAEVLAIRLRLPELDAIARAVRERSTLGNEAPPGIPLVQESPPEPAPEEAPGRPLLGHASLEERDEELARLGRLADLRQVVDASPDDLAIRLAYASALEEAGFLARAREEYQRVAAADPGNAEAAEALARLEAPAEAAPATDEGHRAPAEAETAPQPPARLVRLRDLLATGGADVGARLAYAQALEADGLLEDACAQYRRVLALQPGHPEAAAALSRLERLLPAGLQVPAADATEPAPPFEPRTRA